MPGTKNENTPQYTGKNFQMDLGVYKTLVDKTLSDISKNKILERIWDHDHTVWKDEPEEIINRLGWLNSPISMKKNIDEINLFTEDVRAADYKYVMLMGMGGSSLAPEVFRKIFDSKEGFPELSILDSTNPCAVSGKASGINIKDTLFIISTKSGGTVETLSLMKYFYNETISQVGRENAGEHFTAITDPGSRLETLAGELNFRKTFLNDPDIGGRYSALSYFGLVPAGLLGLDLEVILNRAGVAAEKTKTAGLFDKSDNTAAFLGASMGALALAGLDKVTLITSPALSFFSAWVEQLVAESTGKEGKGILPIAGEPVGLPQDYGNDRIFVYIRYVKDDSYDSKVSAFKKNGRPVIQININDFYDVCGEFFRWEMATVIACVCIKVNPFDQPNVESAKVLAREMVTAFQKNGKLPDLVPAFSVDDISVYSDFKADTVSEALKMFLSQASPGHKNLGGRSYVSLQVYMQSSPEVDKVIQKLRLKILQKYNLATTAGYGPRFLHSTGQLHKGDAGHGLFIQFTAKTGKDLPIPDKIGESKSSLSFKTLIDSQALGDRRALLDSGRKVISLQFNDNCINNLKKVTEEL